MKSNSSLSLLKQLDFTDQSLEWVPKSKSTPWIGHWIFITDKSEKHSETKQAGIQFQRKSHPPKGNPIITQKKNCIYVFLNIFQDRKGESEEIENLTWDCERVPPCWHKRERNLLSCNGDPMHQMWHGLCSTKGSQWHQTNTPLTFPYRQRLRERERNRERNKERHSNAMQWLLLALISQMSAWKWEGRKGNLHVTSFNQTKNEIIKRN